MNLTGNLKRITLKNFLFLFLIQINFLYSKFRLFIDKKNFTKKKIIIIFLSYLSLNI